MTWSQRCNRWTVVDWSPVLSRGTVAVSPRPLYPVLVFRIVEANEKPGEREENDEEYTLVLPRSPVFSLPATTLEPGTH